MGVLECTWITWGLASVDTHFPVFGSVQVVWLIRSQSVNSTLSILLVSNLQIDEVGGNGKPLFFLTGASQFNDETESNPRPRRKQLPAVGASQHH